MLENGYSIRYIHTRYGIAHTQLNVLWAKYQVEGAKGLEKTPNIRSTFELRKAIVEDIEKNHITLHAASLKYGPSAHSICSWLRIAREHGISALAEMKKRGRPKGSMGRPRKNSKPLTELEQLRKENQELKTQIALLKKVRALVDARNARLREIGQKPSKD